MDIVEIIPERIYSIRYDGQEYAEYYRLFNCEWTDVEYLMRFFESHTEFTENEFWNFLDNNPETAAARVIEIYSYEGILDVQTDIPPLVRSQI